ncbi:MAG: hypothetical protein WCJ72_19670 [Chryseobacterium sp.]
MGKYIVYIELFDKKYKIEVDAENKEHAEFIVRNKMIIHKVKKKSLFDKEKEFADLANKMKKDFIDILKT